MYLLKENFLLFTCCGFWTPERAYKSRSNYLLYKLYNFVVTSLTLGQILMKIVNVTLHVNRGFADIQEFAIELFALPDQVTAINKLLTINRKRREILAIERVFFECKKRQNFGVEEMTIQANVDKMCRYTFFFLLIIINKLIVKFFD